MATVRINIDNAAVAAIPHWPEARALVAEIAELVARGAALDAPKRTGAGAASIRPDLHDAAAGWAADISWDQLHYYMFFQEVGWSPAPGHHVPGKHFLENALDRYARL